MKMGDVIALTFSIALASLLIAACSGEAGLGVNPRSSECGGFAEDQPLAKFKSGPDDDAPQQVDGDAGEEPWEEFCPETLDWTTEIETGDLLFVHNGTLLNCCGEHSIRIDSEGDNSYTILETDEPEGGDARCQCTCSFDFSIEMPALDQPGVISVIIQQLVTDSDKGVKTIWSGEIDTREGSGSESIAEHHCYM